MLIIVLTVMIAGATAISVTIRISRRSWPLLRIYNLSDLGARCFLCWPAGWRAWAPNCFRECGYASATLVTALQFSPVGKRWDVLWRPKRYRPGIASRAGKSNV